VRRPRTDELVDQPFGAPGLEGAADLTGVRNTYRLIDGHWTEHGTDIVADRIARELLTLSQPQ
jgi:hypothetical protein